MSIDSVKPFYIGNANSGKPDIVVVPCYNEAKRFKPEGLAQAIAETQTNFIFVNDGSIDNGATLKLLEELKRKYHGRVDFISLTKNRGKAEAVRKGLWAAIQRQPKHAGFFDADGAVPFVQSKAMSDIFEQQNDARAVIGTRTRLEGKAVERSRLKWLSQSVISNMANLLFSPKVSDTQCGAKMFDVKQLYKVILDPFNVRWIFDIELLTRLSQLEDNKKNKNWLMEYPVPSWKEIGNSTRRASSYAEALKDYAKLLKIYGIKKI